jgi:transposase
MDVVILDGGDIIRHQMATDVKGRKTLSMLLRKSDTVGMEMCCCSTMLTRELQAAVGCTVYDLNPGDLRIIWKSRKKTDKEDSLKIAKYIRDTPVEELVTVEIPSVEEEAYRAAISLASFVKEERTATINRLHSLYGRNGIIDVTKKDLADAEGRKARHGELPVELQAEAALLEEQLIVFEKQLKEAEAKVLERTRDNELTPYVMSIPGVGPGIAGALLAHLGDGSRFSKASQVANYAGLTPKVDCSGDTERYGRIAKKFYCKAIRSVVLEGVWAMTRSKEGGALLAKYQNLKGRIGKKKSAVAIARKIVTLAWVLMKRKEFYDGATTEGLRKKFKSYKLRPERWEAQLNIRA